MFQLEGLDEVDMSGVAAVLSAAPFQAAHAGAALNAVASSAIIRNLDFIVRSPPTISAP
jgi:hypothetical protein